MGAAWRADTRRVRAADPGELPARVPDLVDAPAGARRIVGPFEPAFEAAAPKLADLLAPVWAGLDTDWNQGAALATGARRIQRLAAGRAPRAAGDRSLPGRPRTRWSGPSTTRPAPRRRCRPPGASSRICSALRRPSGWGTQSLAAASLATVAAAVQRAASAAADIDDWVALQAVWTPLRDGPLSAAAAWALSPSGHGARGNLAGVFEQRFHELWLASVIDESPMLAEFRGEEHAEALERFKQLDRMWIEARAQAGCRRCGCEPSPRADRRARRGSKAFVLENEIGRSGGTMPLCAACFTRPRGRPGDSSPAS
jgi:hypothetical protein